VNAALQSGASVDAANDNGLSLLHVAALGGHSDVVQLLVDSGAAYNARTLSGETPLALASANGHLNVS